MDSSGHDGKSCCALPVVSFNEPSWHVLTPKLNPFPHQARVFTHSILVQVHKSPTLMLKEINGSQQLRLAHTFFRVQCHPSNEKLEWRMPSCAVCRPSRESAWDSAMVAITEDRVHAIRQGLLRVYEKLWGLKQSRPAESPSKTIRTNVKMTCANIAI
jgi:hypothetical protein